MNRFILAGVTCVSVVAHVSPAIAAPRWLTMTPNKDGAFFQIDLKSIRLVEDYIIQYRHRMYLPENPPEKRYGYRYDRVDCMNLMASMMARFSGVNGDGRMHELGWTTVDPEGQYPASEMFRSVCNYAGRNRIPKLEANWDKVPESYLRYQPR